jgi:hypothetical protein
MMMLSKAWPPLLLGAAALACSGKYQVGGMSGQNGAGDSAVEGWNAAAGSQGLGVAGSFAAGGTFAAGGSAAGGSAGIDDEPGELGSSCVPLGQPEALSGPFVDGPTLWERIAPLVWGEVPLLPTSSLPPRTNYDTLDLVVRKVVENARAQTGGLPGAQRFVAEWLRREGEESITLQGDWSALLAEDAPALPILLQTPLGGAGEIGVFTEPVWRARHGSISGRGGAISEAVFGAGPPPPPPGALVPAEPDPLLSDREALARQISAPVCAACHTLIDPLGFPLGHFDLVGKYRELDHGRAIDLTGSYERESLSISYDGPLDFGVKVADTCAASRGLARGFLSYALELRQVPLERRQELVDSNLERVTRAFIRSGRSYSDLVVAYAQSPLALRQ